MANMRKYSNYTVKITYINGDTEDITVEGSKSLKGKKTSSWLDMLEVYKEIRDEHKNDSCIIEFVGISEEGNLKVIFQKELNIKTTDEQKLDMKTEDIGLQIEDLLQTLMLKKQYCKENLGVYNKKQDFALHIIETYKTQKENISNEDKLKIFDELYEARINRRECKSELTFLELFNDLDVMLDRVQQFNETVLRIKSGETFTKDNIEKYNIMKEVTYRTEKERIHYMSQMKNKYDKTVVDELNKKITFFNYGYTNKKNRKKVV